MPKRKKTLEPDDRVCAVSRDKNGVDYHSELEGTLLGRVKERGTVMYEVRWDDGNVKRHVRKQLLMTRRPPKLPVPTGRRMIDVG